MEEEGESFDLMISQYAGFISRFCTPYLKKKGILLANDSHGDATWAYCSGEYDLIGIVNDRLEIEEDNRDGFFTFARKRDIDIDDLLKKMKGPKYRKMANSYLFQKK